MPKLPGIQPVSEVRSSTFNCLFFFLDSAVLGCRLVVIMDELLWVLTDAQLSSAMVFAQSLSHLIEQDTLTNQRVKVR